MEKESPPPKLHTHTHPAQEGKGRPPDPIESERSAG